MKDWIVTLEKEVEKLNKLNDEVTELKSKIMKPENLSKHKFRQLCPANTAQRCCNQPETFKSVKLLVERNVNVCQFVVFSILFCPIFQLFCGTVLANVTCPALRIDQYLASLTCLSQSYTLLLLFLICIFIF
eukprot:TCONS_00040873-protein